MASAAESADERATPTLLPHRKGSAYVQDQARPNIVPLLRETPGAGSVIIGAVTRLARRW